VLFVIFKTLFVIVDGIIWRDIHTHMISDINLWRRESDWVAASHEVISKLCNGLVVSAFTIVRLVLTSEKVRYHSSGSHEGNFVFIIEALDLIDSNIKNTPGVMDRKLMAISRAVRMLMTILCVRRVLMTILVRE
jgi:hypothetical protein